MDEADSDSGWDYIKCDLRGPCERAADSDLPSPRDCSPFNFPNTGTDDPELGPGMSQEPQWSWFGDRSPLGPPPAAGPPRPASGQSPWTERIPQPA